MAVRDLFRNIGTMFSRVTSDATHRPDGGTSHYRPLRKKAAEAEQGGGNAPADQGQYAYIHTGFTGMNPPADPYGYETQRNFGQNAFSAPAEYTRGRGFTQSQAYSQGQAYTQGQNYTGRGSFRDNISYMPGFAPNPDRGQVHVEHIMTMTGLKSCYEAIECMKNGETLIVTLDAIANESESIRCQDMLAGAAFTLGCSVRLLMGARIVVIAPEGVKILPEAQPYRQEQEAFRPPERMAAGMPAAEATAAIPVRRERRSNAGGAERSAADWSTMPVAAGAYGSFGGYGY